MSTSNSPELELELTYLAASFPEGLAEVVPKRLLDIYIPEDPDTKSNLRIRQKGRSYEMTKKVRNNPEDASSLVEYTIPLSAAEFQALESVSNKRVEKDRYTLEADGKLAEIDVFRGKLEGLVVVDFEFKSEEARAMFSPPEFCGADITQESFIAGGKIAGKSYEDVSPDLNRFNYKPLFVQS